MKKCGINVSAFKSQLPIVIPHLIYIWIRVGDEVSGKSFQIDSTLMVTELLSCVCVLGD